MNNTKQQKAGIILIDHTKNNKDSPLYLIVYSHKSRKFGFPKGTCEENECVSACARREFYEETGFQLKEHVRFTIRYKIRNNTYYILNCYDNLDTLIHQKSLKIPDSNEISYYQWVDNEELLRLKPRCNLGLSSYINEVIIPANTYDNQNTKMLKKQPRFLKFSS